MLSPSFESPEVSLADIQVQEVKTLETSFLIQLRVMNPNDTPLDINGLKCDLALNGRKIAKGVQGAQGTIGPYESILIPVEVYASVLDMVGSLFQFIKNAGKDDASFEEVAYRLTGTVRVGSGGFAATIPFDTDGQIDLK